MKAGSPLINDLAAWIGADALKKQRQWDPTTLKGQRADITLVHIHNKGYPKSFVYVQTISAPGSLVPESVPECRTSIPDNPQRFRLDNIRQTTGGAGGKGGGRPDHARGGGKDASKLDEALAKVGSLL